MMSDSSTDSRPVRHIFPSESTSGNGSISILILKDWDDRLLSEGEVIHEQEIKGWIRSSWFDPNAANLDRIVHAMNLLRATQPPPPIDRKSPLRKVQTAIRTIVQEMPGLLKTGGGPMGENARKAWPVLFYVAEIVDAGFVSSLAPGKKTEKLNWHRDAEFIAYHIIEIAQSCGKATSSLTKGNAPAVSFIQSALTRACGINIGTAAIAKYFTAGRRDSEPVLTFDEI